jgi:hypothetical protein
MIVTGTITAVRASVLTCPSSPVPFPAMDPSLDISAESSSSCHIGLMSLLLSRAFGSLTISSSSSSSEESISMGRSCVPLRPLGDNFLFLRGVGSGELSTIGDLWRAGLCVGVGASSMTCSLRDSGSITFCIISVRCIDEYPPGLSGLSTRQTSVTCCVSCLAAMWKEYSSSSTVGMYCLMISCSISCAY